MLDLERYLRQNGCYGVPTDHTHDWLTKAYADDIVVLAENPAQLKKSMKALKSYFNSNGLILNNTKSKVINFQKAGIAPIIDFYFDGQLIQVINEYCYLGVIFTSSGLSNKCAASRANYSISAMTTALQVVRAARCNSWATTETLFRSLVASIVAYGSEAWGATFLGLFDSI